MSDVNGFIRAYVPATRKALVFRVKNIRNISQDMHYGALPITSGMTVSQYAGGSTTAPAAGVIPAGSYTTSGIAFSTTDSVFEKTDMWYLSENYRNILFDVVLRTTPSFLRLGLELPVGSNQYRFQQDKVTLGVGKSFGWTRGEIETLMIPEIHQGFVFGNDSNIPVYTGAHFLYSEMEVEVPKDPTTVLKVLRGDVPFKSITLPISTSDASVDVALNKVYGYTGFDMDMTQDTATAIASITNTLKAVKL